MATRTVLTTLLALSSYVSAGPAKRAQAAVYSSCSEPNMIALTFDDGPYIYNQQISDALTNAGAKGTFFFNGNNYECIYDSDSIARVKYVYNAGHMVGSHTWSHDDLTTMSQAQIEDALYRMEEAFSRIIGIKPAFMRPPYGNYNSLVQTVAAARGQSLAMWDWDTGDADGNTTTQSEAVYKDVVNDKVSNALILEHETEETTASTLVPFAINLFQKAGYKLVTMAECLGLEPYAAIGVPQQQTSAWTCDGTPDPGQACSGSIACETGTPTLSTTAGGSGPTTTTSTTSTTAPAGPTHVIHPGASSSICLTASSNTNNAAVEIEPCNGSAGQSWTESGGTLVVFGNKCLDVTNGVTTNGNKMQIYTCAAGNTNQQFSITSDNRIAWTNMHECLDLTDGSTAAGNVVQMWHCTTGDTNQVWNIV